MIRLSVSDSDPDWIRIQSGPWIRIRIRIQGQESEEDKNLNISKQFNIFFFTELHKCTY